MSTRTEVVTKERATTKTEADIGTNEWAKVGTAVETEVEAVFPPLQSASALSFVTVSAIEQIEDKSEVAKASTPKPSSPLPSRTWGGFVNYLLSPLSGIIASPIAGKKRTRDDDESENERTSERGKNDARRFFEEFAEVSGSRQTGNDYEEDDRHKPDVTGLINNDYDPSKEPQVSWYINPIMSHGVTYLI